MSKWQHLAGKARAVWQLGLSVPAIVAALSCSQDAEAFSWRATRDAAGQVGPAAVALAVMPPASTLVDQEPDWRRVLWPTHGWAISTPEQQGIDSSALADVIEQIRERHLPVHSLLVERHGKIVLDAYFHPFEDNQLHDVNSVTKSVMSTLVGIALRQHRLERVDTPVMAMLPESGAWYEPGKTRLTLAHMLSMTSGLECGAGGNFLGQMEQSSHWTEFSLMRRQVAEPGTTFNYCPGDMHVVSAVLTKAVGETAYSFAQRELFAPLGIDNISWAVDRDGITQGFSGLRMQPRDMAKLGYLWLHHGVWEGRQLVPATYLDAAFSPHITVGQNVEYGYGMWVYRNVGHAGGAPDVEANGFGGQRIAVIPSQDMVVVTTGCGLDANQVTRLIDATVKSVRPLPTNIAGEARLNTELAYIASGNSRMRVASVAVPFQPHSREGRTTALAAR